jgi:hypothetical protein
MGRAGHGLGWTWAGMTMGLPGRGLAAHGLGWR